MSIEELDARQAALKKEREDWYVDHEAEPWIAGNAFLRGWDAAVDSIACGQCGRADGEHKLDCGERRYAPTDDERETLARRDAADWVQEYDPQPVYMRRAFLRGFDAARRTEAPEPSEREAIIQGDLVTMRVKEWRRITDELARLRTLEGSLDDEPSAEHFHIWSDIPCKAGACRMEDRGEPSSIPFYDEKMRELAEVRAQGEPSDDPAPRGWRSAPTVSEPDRIERVEPQGEPSDAQVEAAFETHRNFPGDYIDLSSAAWQRDRMRAALRAAFAATETGECPQPCEHLSQNDAREGKRCAEHPCTCARPIPNQA